jgi:hypothetical protein
VKPKRFFDFVDEVDSLISKAPSNSDVERFLALAADPALRLYAFSHLDREDWLDLLQEHGAFELIGARDESNPTGQLQYGRPWPELDYLRRLARKRADDVLKIVSAIQPVDDWYLASAMIGLAVALPPAHAAKLVARLIQWMHQSPNAWAYASDDVTKLLVILAENRQVAPTLQLLRATIEVLPDPRAAELASLPLPPSPQGRLDSWEYAQVLQNGLPNILDAIGVVTIPVIADALDSALQLSLHGDSTKQRADYSYIWMPDIAGVDLQSLHNVREMLVVALRDAVRRVSTDIKSFKKCLRILRSHRFQLFERISLDFLVARGTLDPTLAAVRTALLNRKYFFGFEYQIEYSALAHKFFASLREEDRKKIYFWLDNGPSKASLKRLHQRLFDENPTGEQLTERFRRWQRDKLELIGPDLPLRYQQKLSSSLDDFGPTPHRGVQVRWKDPTEESPIELSGLDTKGVAKALAEWDSRTDGSLEKSFGLAQSLSALVARGPLPGSLIEFQLADVTHEKSVFGGLRERIRSKLTVQWDDAIQLAEWTFQQTEVEADDRPANERAEIRRSVIDFIDEALKPGSVDVPIGNRQAVWALLLRAARSEDPALEKDGLESLDAATLSINSLRGVAMHSVVKYGLWVRASSLGPNGPVPIHETASEVLELLDERLDPLQESSPAVRAVYGQWFPWLVLLDRAWAASAVNKVFGSDSNAHIELGRAAWAAYLTFCNVYSEVVPLLLSSYGKALEWLGTWVPNPSRLAEPDEKLGEHVFLIYWRNMLGNEGQKLLDAFFNAADAELRGHVINFVGRQLMQIKAPDLKSTLPRLQEFLAARMAANTNSLLEERRHELEGFGWWFTTDHFDDGWRFPALLKVLRLTEGAIKPVSKVLETVLNREEDWPLEAAEVVRLILFAPGTRHHWASPIVRRILASASTNGSARLIVDDVVQRLGSQGWFEYRDLALPAAAAAAS